MKFIKVNCKVLYYSWGEVVKLGTTKLEGSLAEKAVGVLVNIKLTMSHQCSLTEKQADGIPGCIKMFPAKQRK